MYLPKQNLFFLILALTIAYIRLSEGAVLHSSEFLPSTFIQGVNILTGQIEEKSKTNLQYEKYQEGINQVAEQSIFLSKGDFRVGRVKTIHLQQNEKASPIHFFYELESTIVDENAEQIKIYRYTDKKLLHTIEYYRKSISGSPEFFQSERYFWEENNGFLSLKSRVLQDNNGQATLCYCFSYNEKGQLIKETLIGNLSGNCQTLCQIDESGCPLANGVETYTITYVYSEEDPTLILSQIEDNGLITSYQYNASKKCTAILREDERGGLVSRCFYFYDHQGYLETAISDDGQSRECDDLTGVRQRQIIHLQLGHLFPLEGKPLKIKNFYWEPSFSDSQGELLYEICFDYDEQGNLLSTTDSEGNKTIKVESNLLPPFANVSNLSEYLSMGQIWNGIVDTFFSCFQYLQLSAHQTKMKWNSELRLPAPIAQALEKIGKTLLGEATYLLMGSHFEETHVHSYGQREISNKVRVTFINGILNTRKMMLESLDMISESHGGVKVHYIFRPSEGWTWDISRAMLIRTAFTIGFRSLHARLLADMWKELIQEMGGTEEGGVIIHYAHSLGGTETDRARELLSPEEQKMIRVVTFGSATLVRNVGFQSVINNVSLNDGVTLLEPFGHIRNYFDPNSNVRFYGPTFLHSSAWILCDHFLNGPIYGPLVLEYGEKFLIEFSPSSI